MREDCDEVNTKKRVNNDQDGKRKPWQFMSKFVITDNNGDPYLIRWRIIQTPFFAIYLHKILTGDSDLYVHDHPWTFVSIILRGGYIETRRDNKTRRLYKRHIRHINVMRRDDAHYIEWLDRKPTWSFLFIGRRRRTWGFYVPGVDDETWIEFENWEEWKSSHL